MTIVARCFVLCLIPPIWIASASWIYCSIKGAGYDFEAPYNQWIIAAPWWHHDPWTTVAVVAGAVVPTIILILLASIVGRSMYLRGVQRQAIKQGRDGAPPPLERGMSDNHGHADWLDFGTARRIFPGGTPEYGGVVVGEDDKGALLIDPCNTIGGSGHSIEIAGPGGYKTSGAVTTAIKWHGSSVILDPSTEMGPMLANHMRDDGKRVVMLDMKLRPEGENVPYGVNVLDWIDINDPQAPLHVYTVIDWVFGETQGRGTESGEFFRKWGKDLVACLLAHMLWSDIDPSEKTLERVREGVSVPEPQMRAILGAIHQGDPARGIPPSNSHTARQIAGSLKGMVNETFSGIYGNANQGTSWLSVPAFAELVSGDEFKTSDIGNERMTVFIQIPLAALINRPEVARVLIGALMNSVIRFDGRMPQKKVLFLLDEMARLDKMKVLETARDTGRKYGIVIHGMFQSEPQFDTIWTKEGRRAWYGGSSWYAFSAVQDVDTAREIATLLGKHSVMAYSEGDNSGRQASWEPGRGSRSRGKQINQHEIGRDLMNTAEIIADMPLDEMIVFIRGQKPLRVKRAVWFRRPDIACRVEDNRFAA